ncbi:MAG: AEC family transporter [Butyrivibrio sp.]|uniref:AEC family transporter n=1 Tax=Butyrivibrio sp. TaxID=28121 RepID=UPI001B1EB04F|nr:AEC family transporter [Butyrivibrio sp.]MBO6239265.1 AEC family transporter [Butyrivibrio sp.]
MENLQIATNAVIPFMVYILLGMIAKKSGAVKESFLKELNGVVFKIFFPFIMFNNLYDVDFNRLSDAGYVAFAFAATLIVIFACFFIVPLFVKENPRRGVVMQAIFRSNSVLFAIPLTESVFGKEGAVMASIMVAFIVPLYNIASVAILEYFRGGRVSFPVLLKNILKNPLIIGAIAGVIFNILPVTMPTSLVKPIAELNNMATPLSLFVLGGSLHAANIKRDIRPLCIGIALKLAIIPSIMVTAMSLIGISGAELFVVFCMFATPVAAASYPMAQSMGGDADLAGEYVLLSTLLSIVTIFFWILILKNFGMM